MYFEVKSSCFCFWYVPCAMSLEKESQGCFAPDFRSLCRIQHVLNKNPIPPCRIIHQHMGHRTHQLAVLNDGTAAHE